MVRRPPRSPLSSSSAASDVYKRQYQRRVRGLATVSMRNTLVLLLALASSALAGPQLKAHPLLLLPGFASGRLRTWRDKYCKAELAGLELGGRGAGYKVGDAVWIDTPMIVAQRACFLKCMRLQNGTDPEPTDDGMGSCRLRADEGLDAISQLDPGIITGPLTDVWWTFIQRMSNEMGVAPEDGMVAAPYDWRLSPDMLQMRDNFFTKLRHLIEEQVLKRPGVDCGSRPDHCPGIVVVAHSMGNNVFRYFVEWLEADLGSRHYKKWLDRYVFMFAAVGAPWIGASEAVRSIFSGNTFGLPVSVAEARSMGSTFGSAPIMMPVGTPGEDPRKNSITQLRFDSPDGNGVFGAASLIEEDGPLSSLGKHGDHVGAMFHETVQGMKRDPAVDIYKLPERLPLKRIVCAYGVNRATEAGYHYTWDEEYKVPVLEEVIYEQPPSASAPLEWQQGLPDDLSHKSGDGTVNYASLAWCKRWLGSVANVTMIPEGALLESNATIKGRNADITDFSKRTAGIPANLYWESDTTTEEGDHQYTQVWEFENVEHRDVIKAPPFLKEFVALLASARNHYSEISHAQHNMGPLYGVETRKTLGGGQVPTTNAECTWDFSQMECAFQQYCNYDLSLIHISEPTRLLSISYAVFCLKKKKKKQLR
eukprot:TRINITY_DN720_c0_g1_i1.p1 TRINITY_DN720_c0_g1~~TRINITY_DN720_c0_g1_i1.p1  ORF type:complete len:649 (-),score=137.05 TRINITY_DN720_c0_g1_i1:63-2009(-)